MSFPKNGFSHHAFEILTHGIHKDGLEVEIISTPRPFTLDRKISPFLPQLEQHWRKESPKLTDMPSIFSVRKVRLQDDKIRFSCRPATFFDFLFTNCSLDLDLKTSDDQWTTLRSMLEQGQLGESALDRNKKAATYGFPKLGNSLSISVAIITSDNQLIACLRKQDSQSYSKDKGCWVCPVATHVKRHEPRFLDGNGNPSGQLSAQQGIADELGKEIAETCSPPVCLGLAYREDLHCCCLIYRSTSTLSADGFTKIWAQTGLIEQQEYTSIAHFNLDEPEKLLAHLEQKENCWSPQHSATAFFCLAYDQPRLVSNRTGLFF